MNIVIKHEQDCHSRGDEWDRTGWDGMGTEIIRMRLFEKISFLMVHECQTRTSDIGH
jgi:hypothetical protein